MCVNYSETTYPNPNIRKLSDRAKKNGKILASSEKKVPLKITLHSLNQLSFRTLKGISAEKQN